MLPEDDDALVAAAVRGDEAALERLFRRYYATMHRFAQKICADPSDAEDVVQDAIIKLMGAIGGFDRRSRFSSWLYRVVLNTALDHRRRAARRGRLGDDFSHVSPTALAPSQDDSVAARQVVEMLLGFPDRERDAVLLVSGEGLTHKQAAEVIGCPTGTIGWLLGKAEARLRALLDTENHDQGHAQDGVRKSGDDTSVARC